LSKAKIQLRNLTDFLQDSKVNLILGDLNLDYEKRRENSYQHRKIYDERLETFTAFDFIQVVKELTWERIHNNNVQTSILDYRVRHKFGNQLKCQYLKKYLTY